jgi:hypothetical protein
LSPDVLIGVPLLVTAPPRKVNIHMNKKAINDTTMVKATIIPSGEFIFIVQLNFPVAGSQSCVPLPKIKLAKPPEKKRKTVPMQLMMFNGTQINTSYKN